MALIWTGIFVGYVVQEREYLEQHVVQETMLCKCTMEPNELTFQHKSITVETLHYIP